MREILEQVPTPVCGYLLIEVLLSEGWNTTCAIWCSGCVTSRSLHLSLLLADASRDEVAVTSYEMLISLRGAKPRWCVWRSLVPEIKPFACQISNSKTIIELELIVIREQRYTAADLEASRDHLLRVELELLDRVNGFRLDLDFLQPGSNPSARARQRYAR